MAFSMAGKQQMELSPGTQGSCDTGSSKPRKGEKTRRTWSPREDEILLFSLKELVAHGWKSDNGFRAGFMNKLEDAIRKEFPNTNIKVNPHIMSKITAWKKNYYSLQGILSRSGVGFNLKGDHMIDCDNEQWEQIVKVDANARLMRNKPWPYWDEWQEIFGKDRANGENAEDIMEAVNNLYAEEDRGADIGAGYEYSVSADSMLKDGETVEKNHCEGGGDSVCQSEKEKVKLSAKRSNKKRKTATQPDGIVELLSKMHEDTNARLEIISSRIGYEVDLSRARKEVYGLLGRIPGLSLDNKFDVCAIIVEKPDRLDMFMSLPEEDREAYVKRLLRENRNN